LLVVDGKIIAFEPYLPFVGRIWREIMDLDRFIGSGKSFVAYLHRYTYVSYYHLKV
jgi:hypothetical protein